MQNKLLPLISFKSLVCFLFLLLSTVGHSQLLNGEDGGSGLMAGQILGYKYDFWVQLGDVDCEDDDESVSYLVFSLNNEEIFRIVKKGSVSGQPNFSYGFGNTSSSGCRDGDDTFNWWLIAKDQETLNLIATSFVDDSSVFVGRFTYTLPSEFLISGNLTVNASNTNDQTSRTPFFSSISAPILPSLSDLRISSSCNAVKVAWDKLKIVSPFSLNEFKYKVYKDNVLLATLNGDAIEYNPTNVDKESEFKVILFWNNKEVQTKTQVGSPHDLLPIPADLQATTDKCDGKIDLKWQWTQVSPTNFVIYKSTSENGIYTVHEQIAGTKRSYSALGLSPGTKYYFKIAAKGGKCPDEGLKSDEAVVGLIPIDPVSPTNALMEMQSGNNSGIKISWNETLWTADYFANPSSQTYKIIRKDLKKGTETVIEIPIEDFYQSQIVNPTIGTNGMGLRLYYIDNEIETCESYSYKIIASTNCKSTAATICFTPTGSDKLSITNITLSEIFEGTNLQTSKGYYPEIVELSWSIDKFESFVDQFKIYRRTLGSTIAPELVASLNGFSRSWDDTKAIPKTLYEYFVLAEADCGLDNLKSYSISSVVGQKYEQLTSIQGLATGIGFRLPVATVTGNITYTGGFAVPNVKVVAERDGQTTGNSLYLDGTNQYVKINPKEAIKYSSKGFSTAVWIKPDALSGNKTIAKQNGVFELVLNNKKVGFTIGNNTIESNSELEIDKYSNITASCSADSIHLYINGKKDKSIKRLDLSDLTTSSTATLYLGSEQGNAPFYKGHIDEFRLYKSALSPYLVSRDYSRVIHGETSDLAGYWRFDEGVGPMVFDASKESGVYHKHDGELMGTTWSSQIPSKEQLGFAGFTDNNGNYIIEGILYNGTGENFRITPTMTLSGSIHEFTPAQRILFLGNGRATENNQDFIDKSSFKVTGFVRYDFKNDENDPNSDRSAGSPGVSIWLDGTQQLLKNNEPIVTNSFGDFEIMVPIGKHFLEFRKNGHTFFQNKFPEEINTNMGVFDFQDILSGIEIYDTTKHTLVGCVVGGLVEGEKKVGFYNDKGNLKPDAQRVNNIGKAYFTLTSVENPDLKRRVETDPETGDFEIQLPPNEYNFSDVYLVKDPDTPGSDKLLKTQSEIQSIKLADIKAYEGLSEENLVKVNGIFVNKKVSFNAVKKIIIRSTPNLTVENDNGINFLPNTADIEPKSEVGETTLKIYGKGTPVEVKIPTQSLKYPLFIQGKQYKTTIKAIEVYDYFGAKPAANPARDEVPVLDGDLTINNNISATETGGDVASYLKKDGVWEFFKGSKHEMKLQNSGTVDYTFMAGDPNLIQTNPASESFIKSLSITLKTAEKTIYWPEANNLLKTYTSYVMGAKKMPGTDFVTVAPVEIQTTIRIPPGSNSSVTIEKGSTFAIENSNSTTAGGDWNSGIGLAFNYEAEIPLSGTKLANTEGQSMISSYGSKLLGSEKNVTATNSFTENFTISSQDSFDKGDFFISSSSNIEIGRSSEIKFIPSTSASCVGCQGLVATGNDGIEYTLNIGNAYYQKEIDKTFLLYSENHIKTDIIPKLELIRNSLFIEQPTIYSITAGVSPENPLFGTNNDDPRWDSNASGLNDYTKDNPEDDSGVSYTFNRANAPIVNGVIQDKVRWYNNQIRAWQEILMNNEIEKWIASQETSANTKNISISSGIAYTNSSTVEKEEVIVRSTEIMAGTSIDAEAKFLIGAGFLVGPTISIHSGLNTTSTTNNTNSSQKAVTTSYTIQDNDSYNVYNLNVHNGKGNNSPVFEVVAGQTSCPFEREKEMEITKNHIYYLKYWIANLPSIILDKKTNINTVANEEIAAIDKQIRSLSCLPDTNEFENCTTFKNYLLNKKTEIASEKESSVSRIEDLLNAKKVYFEGLYSLFEQDAEPLLGARTVQIEKPSILVNGNEQASMLNVPSTKAAIFNLELRNETELIPSSANDQITYQLSVDPASNPEGLVVLLNGENLVRPVNISIPFGQKLRQTLTVFRGPNEYKYNGLKLLFESVCDASIHKEITMDIEYIPICAEATVASPGNKWTINYDSKNKLGVKVNGYDVNYEGFKFINVQYKRSSASESEWRLLETYYRDAVARTNAGPDEVTRNAPLLNEQRGNEFIYNWDVTNLPDDLYDVRLQSVCKGDNEDVIFTSPTISGIIDRVNPHTFGLPQPADGLLEAGDEILLQFNEPINAGLLGPSNFDIRGVIQGGPVKHPASIYFNGTSDFMEIPEGILLNRRSFSVDFYAKRKQTGPETILSQGSSTNQSFSAGFNAANEFEVILAGKKINSENSIPINNSWVHFAFMYDAAEAKAFVYINGLLKGTVENFSPNYEATGKIYVAKNILNESPSFKGNMHELRFWGKALSAGQVNIVATKRLKSNEPSLIGNWRMEESEGIEVADLVRERNAEIKSGTWEVALVGNALKTSLNSNLTIKSPAYEEVSNFTVEFWFKGDGTTNATLLSNGRGDSLDSNKNGWSVRANSSGLLEIWNNNKFFKATEKSYFDNQWHHFAVVVNRSLNTVCFIDGNQQNSKETAAIGFSGFGGAAIHLGALGWVANDTSTQKEQYFDGALDEIRIWQGTRNALQIKRDMRYMLSGDESGLDLYLPFDSYINNLGIEMLEPSKASAAAGLTAIRDNGSPSIIEGDSPAYSQETPLVKLPRPIRKINFTYSANQDKIIFTTSDPDYTIENVLLDISVQNVKDLNGNSMKETVRWTAYVDKNQVVWLDNIKQLEIESGKGFTFSTSIKNTGGKIFNYTIKNLPPWITATPSSGVINPVSTLPITFTIDKNTNIGNYVQDILLETEFGFDEVFNLNLNVVKPLPDDWKVNPSDFELSMNFIAQLRINGEISRDQNDQVAAFVGDQCRGIAKLKYNATLDNYQAFISVYSNSENNEEIQFRIWNASDGQVHRDVTPSYFFESNEVKGTLLQPEILNAVDVLEHTYNLAKGWTWISSHLNFNYDPTNQLKTNDLFKPIKSINGDLIRDIDSFDSFDTDEGWLGTLTAKGGIKNGKGYKIYLNNESQLKYSGLLLKGDQVKIDLVKGWNWIGYIGFKNTSVNQALAGFSDVSNGDVIKSQYTMAQYSSSIGWIGDLTVLEPGVGYMMRTAKAGGFYYPNLNYSASTSKTSTFETKNAMVPAIKTSVIQSSFVYSSTMNIIAEVVNDNQSMENTLRAYVGNELRGETYPILNPITNKTSYFMTLYGQKVEDNIRFEWYNALLNKTMPVTEKFDFKPDVIIGNTSIPQLLTVVEPIISDETIMAHPNPFTNFISLKLFAGHKAAKFILFDILGHEIQNITIKSDQNEMKIDMQNLPFGIYILSINDALGTSLYTQKLIKK